MIQIKNKVIISDPCYVRGGTFMTEQDNMLEGNYNYYVEEYDGKDWGMRIKSIEIVHESYKRPKRWKFKDNSVGVDSGQAGIFCDSIYPEKETGEYGDLNTFYGKCCELTSQNYEDVQIYYKLISEIEDSEKNKDNKVYFNNLEWSYQYYKEIVESLVSLETYITKRKEEYEESKTHLKTWEEYLPLIEAQYYENIKSKYYHKRFNIYHNYMTKKELPPEPKLIKFGIIDNKGLVSSSGYGDGVYSSYANFNKEGKCIGIKIRYI